MSDNAIIALIKTIYNWSGKTQEQREQALELAAEEFMHQHPGYVFHSYKKKEGKHGEKTVTFYFIRQETKAKEAKAVGKILSDLK